MDQILFHIDVNSAFLSWSAIKKLAAGIEPDLRSIPSVIGGDGKKRHGIVLAKSIPAKSYGIYTSEPLVSAMKKCPGLVIEPPDPSLYSARSRELMNYLHTITPDIEQLSIDECFLDFGPISCHYASAMDAAFYIKEEIKKRFGYTVNIGISDRKILAKMASDFKKPNLIHTLFSSEIGEKFWPLPVSSLYMCGSSSSNCMKNLGIITIGDLAKADPEILSSHLKSHGIQLWEYANGIDPAGVESNPGQMKGIGNSTTLHKDVDDRDEACKTLLELAESVGSRLRSAAQLAAQISVEIKYCDFHTVSHQLTLFSPTDSTDLIYQNACALFDDIWDGTPVRLLGIRTSRLADSTEPVQISLFDLPDLISKPADHSSDRFRDSNEKHKKLDQALDSIRSKYGADSVKRASLLKNGQE